MLILDSSSTISDEEVFTNYAGTIVSPNYPNNYGNDAYKRYKITAPKHSEILLIFNDFDVEPHSSCGYDYLKVSANISIRLNIGKG